MRPSPSGCGLGPREYYFSRPQRVHFCYGPVTRNLPSGGFVDRLRRFCCHLPRYPNYRALTSAPAGLSPAEHASLHWTHNRSVRFPAAAEQHRALANSLPDISPWETCGDGLRGTCRGIGFQNYGEGTTGPPTGRASSRPSVHEFSSPSDAPAAKPRRFHAPTRSRVRSR
jgi:hypothetical protein